MNTQTFGMPPAPEETIAQHQGLQLFTYSGSEVRTILIDGEPWFVLNDLCKVLEISNPYNVVDRLDPECLRKTEVLDGRGISRETNIVNESGMYEVVIRSNAPLAAAFRKWLVSEVLPAIRKTGSYGQVAPTGPELLALAVVEAQKMIAEKNQAIGQLEMKIEQDAPKVIFWETYCTDEDKMTFRTAANVLKIGEQDLRDGLVFAGWIYRETRSRWSKTQGAKEYRNRYSAMAHKKKYFDAVLEMKAPRFGSEAMHALMISIHGAAPLERWVRKLEAEYGSLKGALPALEKKYLERKNTETPEGLF